MHLKTFKKFLDENCYDPKRYDHGEYDKIIYDYFQDHIRIAYQNGWNDSKNEI